jgi:hypothetical protein
MLKENFSSNFQVLLNGWKVVSGLFSIGCISSSKLSCVQQSMPAIPALGKLKHEDHKFKANLGYIVRLCLKINKNKK